MAYNAESVVVEVIAKTDGYEARINGAAGATAGAMSRIEQAASRAEGQIVRSAGAMANAQRNLGRQVADVGAQLAGGQSPFLILAQQAPQVADALADTGGKAARLAAFFAGPWGAALLAAGSIAGVLGEKLFKTASAHDELKRSADASAEAERLLQGVIGGTINQTEKARLTSLDRAKALAFEARAALNTAQSQLALARAQSAAASVTEGRGATGLGIPGRGAASSAVRLRDKQTEADIAQIALNASEIRLRNLEKIAGTARAIEARSSRTGDARTAPPARRTSAAPVNQEAQDTARLVDAIRRDLLEITRSTTSLVKPEIERLREASQRFKEVFGDQSDVIGDGVGAYEREARAEVDARTAAEERVQSVREDNVRSLAYMYEDLFQQGTDGLWRNFQDQGLRAVAMILAQATIASFSSGGGGFGSLLGNIGKAVSGGNSLSSLFGCASGGYVGPGQTVRVNENRPGVELLRMGAQGGTVIPLGQAAAARPAAATVVHQHFSLDARGALTTPQFIAGIKGYVNQQAAAAGQGAYKQAIRDSPAAIGQFQRLGTTR